MYKKLALGTVQFGLDYGIANRTGKVQEQEARKILEFAWSKGIDTLDTAYSYGDSEDVIGQFMSGKETNYRIISKMPDLEREDLLSVDRYLSKTLQRLKQDRIYGYLAHKFENVMKFPDLFDELQLLKNKGLIEKTGLSIYSEKELEYLLERKIDFDILQIPYNIFDQRFKEYFSTLKDKGIEIHARSVFLQGLFFLEDSKLEAKFNIAKEMVGKIRCLTAEYEIPMYALCLCFALLNPSIDNVIIGVDSIGQLKQNIDAIKFISKVRDLYELLEKFELSNEEIILPYRWK